MHLSMEHARTITTYNYRESRETRVATQGRSLIVSITVFVEEGVCILCAIGYVTKAEKPNNYGIVTLIRSV